MCTTSPSDTPETHNLQSISPDLRVGGKNGVTFGFPNQLLTVRARRRAPWRATRGSGTVAGSQRCVSLRVHWLDAKDVTCSCALVVLRCTLSSYHPLTYRNVKPKRSVRISRLALAGAAAGTLRVAWRRAAAVVPRN